MKYARHFSKDKEKYTVKPSWKLFCLLLCRVPREGKWTRRGKDERVDKVLGFFFSSSPNWDCPTPSPAGECVPPGSEEDTHSLAEEGWGVPNSDEGTDTLALYMYFVVKTIVFACSPHSWPSLSASVEQGPAADKLCRDSIVISWILL